MVTKYSMGSEDHRCINVLLFSKTTIVFGRYGIHIRKRRIDEKTDWAIEIEKYDPN